MSLVRYLAWKNFPRVDFLDSDTSNFITTVCSCHALLFDSKIPEMTVHVLQTEESAEEQGMRRRKLLMRQPSYQRILSDLMKDPDPEIRNAVSAADIQTPKEWHTSVNSTACHSLVSYAKRLTCMRRQTQEIITTTSWQRRSWRSRGSWSRSETAKSKERRIKWKIFLISNKTFFEPLIYLC